MPLIQFYENNSGGGRWLTPKQWNDLEKAGWRLGQCETFVYNEQGNYRMDKAGIPVMSGQTVNPTSAFKQFPSIELAIEQWALITGEDPEEQGCNCCGHPYEFTKMA